MRCPVCDSRDPQWPTVDAATGFRFCGACYEEAVARMPASGVGGGAWPDWLEAIAAAHREVKGTVQHVTA